MKAWYLPAAAFTILILRYTVLSGLSYLYFWRWKKNKFAHRRIQKKFPRHEKIRNEIKWSLITFLTLSGLSTFFFNAIQNGQTKLYLHINQLGLPYFFGSILFLIVAHDTYFYWAHRFMHLKFIFKHVHRVHHLSTNPSPLAAFSFHPLEAVIEGAFVAAMIFVIPLHPAALGLFLLFSHVMNVIGHLGYEFFPSAFKKHWLGSFLNSATHHNDHHRYFKSNYGLYFNFWDRFLDTAYEKVETETHETLVISPH